MSRAFLFAVVGLIACGPGATITDGGVADSGSGSTVAPDAGSSFDAGEGDAGAGDAGVLDAGALDAGAADAGLPDAGALDAGLTADAGALDAGARSDGGVGVLVGGPGTWPGAIAGVHFVSGSTSGVTDALGTFHWEAGHTVTFSVGDVSFVPVTGAAKVTAWQLAGAPCTRTPDLDKALVLLFSLDGDADPTNGVTIPTLASSTAATLTSLSLADVNTRVGQLISGRTALSPAVAVDRFIRQVDDETWAELSIDTFSGATALRRGQGVASDGTSWFFSGTLTLERTDLQFNTLDSNNFAIPALLAIGGSDHIGDIDVYNGTLYAPVEDGSKNYMNPKVVLYGAQSLSAGTTYSISHTLQTQGVPWIAVNGPKNEAYLAEWNPTSQLNIFTLSSMQVKSALPLTLPPSVTLGRIQGAKVLESALYLATDDAMKNVFKLDLETGTVLRLFSVNTTGEQEGVAVLARPDGTLLHTLNVNAARSGSELRHHQRTRLPLRRDVCP